jgi:integrase
VRKRDIQPLDQEQAKHLLVVARDSSLECLLTLAVATGMRLGELLALRWSDISIEKKIIQVRHMVDYIQGHGYLETEPKTESGKRTIPITQFALDALKSHKAAQLEARLKAGSQWKDQGLVFTNRQGRYLSRNPIRNRLKKLLEQVGLPPMRFHDLRHSAATILLSMGVNAKVIQELLGHAHISVTLGIYGHASPSMQRDAINRLDDLFREEK